MAVVSPVRGSTAPAITSPLLAWPSKPVERSSPLSSPSSISAFESQSLGSMYSKAGSSSSHTLASASSSIINAHSPTFDLKGKGRAPDVVVSEDDRRYGPPKQPLTPNQLGRIAQSFGIVIPSLPLPSPSSSPSGSTRHPSTITTTRGSPYLLTVIPPFALLNPSGVDEERRRRWKRGRLLPLQPTMGSMLLCIAREYGLPSTTGLELFLVNSASSISSSASTVSTDECAGPLISPSTWSTLFSTYLHHSTSRSSSPSHTPLRSTGPLGRDVAFPPSPLSLVEKHTKSEQHSFHSSGDRFVGSNQSTASSGSSRLPLTPGSSTQASLSSMIAGTIEFDVDPNVAIWLDEWRRSGRGHRRKASSLSDSGASITGGKRQLRLVKKVEDAKSRNERLDPHSVASLNGGRSRAATSSISSERSLQEADLNVRFGDRTGRRLSIQHPLPGLISVSPSMDQFTESDQTKDTIDPSLLAPEIVEVDGRNIEDLLASPIELDKVRLERVRMADGPKRGSGLVMAEELDDLERIMRSLSPREIRVTSPRALTPRMTAKIAAAKVQASSLSLPIASRSTPTSPLARGQAKMQAVPPPLPVRPKMPHTPKSSNGPDEATSQTQKGRDKPSWPAVPYDSPVSPNMDDMFRPQNASASISAETLKRMQTSPPRQPATEWRPPRPPRPKSPDLSSFGHARTLSHTLSPELAEQLRSPTSAVHPADSPASPPPESKPRLRGRAGSVSLKGLRHQMSGKNLNLKWGNDKDKEPMPSTTKETVGLFKGATEGTSASTFASLRDSLPATVEFGQVEPATLPQAQEAGSAPATAPGSGGKHGLASRFFSFGRRGSTKDVHPAQRSVSAPKTATISSPISSSFHKVESNTTPLSRASESSARLASPPGVNEVSPPVVPAMLPQSPSSPASPRSVKRKPVPGFEGVVSDSHGHEEDGMRPSDSMNSMRSFVLADPPKGKAAKNLA